MLQHGLVIGIARIVAQFVMQDYACHFSLEIEDNSAVILQEACADVFCFLPYTAHFGHSPRGNWVDYLMSSMTRLTNLDVSGK